MPVEVPALSVPNVFERLYLSLSKRLGKQLFDDLLKERDPGPRTTFARVLAYAIALPIHAITGAFVMIGMWATVMLVTGWNSRILFLNVSLVVIGTIAFLIAKALAPSMGQMPKETLNRDTFPTLYAVTDEVTDALGISHIDAITVTADFNAAFTVVGLRGKHVLYLGLPLVTSLSSDELVALLAHEMAHGRNGDPIRGFIIAGALHSLVEWYSVLRPPRTRRVPFAVVLFVSPIMALLSLVPYTWAWILAHLTWRDKQWSEYIADYLGAQVSGTAAQIKLLAKSHLSNAYSERVRMVLERWSYDKHDLYSEWRRYTQQLPQRELRRFERIDQCQEAQIDATHPPSGLRIKFLKAHDVQHSRVTLTTEQFVNLHRELAVMDHRLQSELVYQYAA